MSPNRAKEKFVINIYWTKEARMPKVIREMGAPRETIIIEVDFKTNGDIEGVEVAETEVNKTNTIIDLRIEILKAIGNGDNRTITQVITTKVTEEVLEMKAMVIIITEAITIREEATDATLRAEVAVEIHKHQKDRLPLLTLINIVRFVTKRGTCLMNALWWPGFKGLHHSYPNSQYKHTKQYNKHHCHNKAIHQCTHHIRTCIQTHRHT